jgi:hypothetical protein
MSGYPDDPRDYDDRDRNDRGDRGERRGDRRDDEEDVRYARSALGAPGTLLLLNGLLGLFLCTLLFAPTVVQPDIFIQAARNFVAQQPQGPDRKEAEEKLDEAEKEIQQNPNAVRIENGIKLIVVGTTNLLAIVGGFAMRRLGSYGLSMTGAIISIIPCVTGCCFTGMPLGIWALVVLVRPEVKAGFAAKRRLAGAPDSY